MFSSHKVYLTENFLSKVAHLSLSKISENDIVLTPIWRQFCINDVVVGLLTRRDVIWSTDLESDKRKDTNNKQAPRNSKWGRATTS